MSEYYEYVAHKNESMFNISVGDIQAWTDADFNIYRKKVAEFDTEYNIEQADEEVTQANTVPEKVDGDLDDSPMPGDEFMGDIVENNIFLDASPSSWTNDSPSTSNGEFILNDDGTVDLVFQYTQHLNGIITANFNNTVLESLGLTGYGLEFGFSTTSFNLTENNFGLADGDTYYTLDGHESPAFHTYANAIIGNTEVEKKDINTTGSKIENSNWYYTQFGDGEVTNFSFGIQLNASSDDAPITGTITFKNIYLIDLGLYNEDSDDSEEITEEEIDTQSVENEPLEGDTVMLSTESSNNEIMTESTDDILDGWELVATKKDGVLVDDIDYGIEKDEINFPISGFFSTRVVGDDGSVVLYTHDGATLADSVLVWRFTADKISVSTDGGTTYPYAFYVTGDMVANILDVIGIKSKWINVDELLAKSSITVGSSSGKHLTLNSSGANISDSEQTYLTLSSNATTISSGSGKYLTLKGDTLSMRDDQQTYFTLATNNKYAEIKKAGLVIEGCSSGWNDDGATVFCFHSFGTLASGKQYIWSLNLAKAKWQGDSGASGSEVFGVNAVICNILFRPTATITPTSESDGITFYMLSDGTPSNAVRATYNGTSYTWSCVVLGASESDKAEFTLQGRMVINSDNNVNGTGPTSAAPLLIGTETGKHLEFDGDEIASKKNEKASTLILNAGGGDVTIGEDDKKCVKIDNGVIYEMVNGSTDWRESQRILDGGGFRFGYGAYENSVNTNVFGSPLALNPNGGDVTIDESGQKGIKFNSGVMYSRLNTIEGSDWVEELRLLDNGGFRLGYGAYQWLSPTYIYGGEVRFYVKAGGSKETSLKPYYEAGDSFTTRWVGAGFVSSSKVICFSLPLSKPIVGSPTIKLSDFTLRLRQGGKYTHGSSSTSFASVSSYSIEGDTNNHLRIYATMSSTTNAVNNDVVGVDANVTVTFS